MSHISTFQLHGLLSLKNTSECAYYELGRTILLKTSKTIIGD